VAIVHLRVVCAPAVAQAGHRPVRRDPAVAAVLTDRYEMGRSLLPLGINPLGIVAVATLTLAIPGRAHRETVRARAA
jgi:hypothetical protein